MRARPGQEQRAGDVTAPDSAALEAWFDEHRRDLPWRHRDTSPWGVLVSEVMSQQTPVARVAPLWQQWMARWPTPADLAEADTGEVLRLWGNLGYPRRALRLIECARAVVARHGGRLPADFDELLALPGVGHYTAGAVMAFAYGRRALTLDTNVRRVLARAVGGQALPAPSLGRAERHRAEAVLPRDDARAARWSMAVMELGALVCTAKDPRCPQCPWQPGCAWVAVGRPADAHAERRRVQAWHGTDRQARGMVMARLRNADPGRALTRAELLAAAAGAGARAAGGGDPGQPERALATLEADGLIVSLDGGQSFALP
ncbi:MAG: A/G-specific adenine glycosylase [Actinomyces sp.]|uniref:A/G-specific adenine glycosylase n=1 Tax=Actinomyces sp. TaxID=29317 RepID=UPI0026DADDB3|nr:A/G-specific adenine glycosylase [Actinomyces sp.]MDO4244262.1 A/G-specific adenine glycosylase [Actinomyces sp.]